MADQHEHDHHPRLSSLIGHDEVARAIASEDQSRRHHSFILNGPKGIGKATAAYRAAEVLLAAPPPEAGLFGETPSLSVDAENPEARLVRAGSHPDLLTIEKDSTKASGGISVDDVRRVIPFLAHTPSRGAHRVVIIDALDDMNVNGANAILKTLEEPPENAVIMIINHQSKPVLPTIRSRVQMVNLSPLDFDTTLKVIGDVFPEADQDWVGVAAALTDGAPGIAALLAEAGAVDLYAETTQMLAGEMTDYLTIDALASQWGAGGVKNLARRQMGVMLMMRFLTMAARKSARNSARNTSDHQLDGKRPRLDIEDRAIDQICQKHQAAQLADWHQDYRGRFAQAEKVNLDAAPIYFDLLSNLAGLKS